MRALTSTCFSASSVFFTAALSAMALASLVFSLLTAFAFFIE